MNEDAYPYADTRAARILGEALAKKTSENPGGLRAIAARLDMKQAVNLSRMANGRMPIPLERAVELAAAVSLNAKDFCLAVIEQRAPGVFEALGQGSTVLENRIPDGIARALAAASSTNFLSDEHNEVIMEVLKTKRPAERWVRPLEDYVLQVIRERYPDGMSLDDSRELANWIKLMPDD